MKYMNFLEIILGTVKEVYGEQFDNLAQQDKAAVVMKFASDICGAHKDIMEAVAIATQIELTA